MTGQKGWVMGRLPGWARGTLLLVLIAGCRERETISPGGAGGTRGGAGSGGQVSGDSGTGSEAGGSAGRDAATEPSPLDASTTSDAAPDGFGSCFGVCLETWFSQCPKAQQTCVQTVSGSETTICYGNGVKQRIVTDATAKTASGTVRKANGDVCYQWSSDYVTETITDGTGGFIASILQDVGDGGWTVTTSCGTAPVVTTDYMSTACAQYYEAATQTCQNGTCIW